MFSSVLVYLYVLIPSCSFTKEYRIHLSFTKWNEGNYYDFLFDFVKVPSYTSLASYRTNIKKLTDWIISEKKEIDGEILEKNIFDESNGLDMESLVIQMSTRMEMVYFDEDMLDKICNSIVLNWYYMELVFRLFYAGFPSVMSIVELKEDMIDLENKCIHLEYGRKIPVDVKLESAIQRMLNNEIKEAQYPDSDKVKPLLKENEEDFFRFTTIKEDKDNDNKRRFINKLIRITQTQLNMELLPKRFYHSGILNYLYRKMGKETTIQLLSENGREKKRGIQLCSMMNLLALPIS